MATPLPERWQELLGLFAVSSQRAERLFAMVVDQYQSGGRVYHTLEHVQDVLATMERITAPRQPAPAALLAAWFHDVIYDPQAHDNEARSAAFARETLSTLGLPELLITSVADLILITRTHRAPDGDRNAQLLVDADLAILGAPPPRYRWYARAIRQEYGWVDEETYRRGRVQVLQQLLARSPIYYTAVLRERREARARRNMQREISFWQQ